MTPPPLLLGFVLVLLLLLLSAALGHRLFRFLRVRGLKPVERGLLMIGLGLGSLQTISFVLLALGIAGPAAFRIAAVGLALCLALDLIAVFRKAAGWLRVKRSCAGWEACLGVVFAVFLLAVFLRAFCPITDDDGLSYHLTAAVRLLAAGRFVFLPTFTYTNWPLGVESLFMLLLGLHPAAPVGIVQFLFALLTLAAVYLLARRLAGPTAAAAATVLLLTYKVFWEESVQAHVDLGTSLFATLAVYALVCSVKEPDAGRLRRLSALFAGLAATTKLNGVWVIVALSIINLFLREMERDTPGDRLRRAAGYAVMASCVVAPWFLRTWVVTGNPFYPIFFGLFGGPEWTAQGWPRIQQYFLLMNTPPGLPPTHQNLLLGRAALVLGTLMIAALVYRSTRKAVPAIPARFAATFALFVFLGSGYNLRFLLAAYPCVVVAVACNFKGRQGWAPFALCAVGAILAYRVAVPGLDIKLPAAIQAATGATPTEAYLRNVLPDYPVVEYVNRELAPSARLLVGTWEESTAYYEPFAMRANYWLQDSVHYDSQARLEADLRRLGVTHLVLRPMEQPWCSRSSVCDGRDKTETRALFDLAARRGTKLYEANGVVLYALNAVGR